MQSSANFTNCISCTAGYYCPTPAVGPEPCLAGTYSTSGNTTECTQCPAGSYCGSAATAPTSCASGTHSLAAVCRGCVAHI
jgi:hypothetical protein